MGRHVSGSLSIPPTPRLLAGSAGALVTSQIPPASITPGAEMLLLSITGAGTIKNANIASVMSASSEAPAVFSARCVLDGVQARSVSLDIVTPGTFINSLVGAAGAGAIAMDRISFGASVEIYATLSKVPNALTTYFCYEVY